MLTKLCALLFLVFTVATVASPNLADAQTIYWKMDHIRDANGVEVAVATPLPSDQTAPSAPSSLTDTSVSDSSVTLSWTGSTDSGGSGMAGYRIYRFNIPIGIASPGTGTRTFTDSTLQPGTVYVYKVAAFDAAGNQSSFSNSHTFTTSGVPAAPGSLHAYRPSSVVAINLYWTDHSLSETGFKIERSTWSGGSYSQIDIVGHNATTYSDSSVENGTIYYYRVRAYNGGGNSSYSNEASACSCTATATTLSAVASSTSQVDLTWSTLSGPIDHYSVQRRSHLAGSYSEIGTTSATNYPDTTVSANTTYMYKIVGVDSGGMTVSASTEDIATTVIFADDPLVVQTTVVKIQHITDLRTAVNAVRAAADLSAATWTDSSLSGVTIKAVHISELRTALNAALSAMGFSVPTYTEGTLTAHSTSIKKIHITELRQALK